MKQRTLLALHSEGLENTLRDDNLWWRGERMFGQVSEPILDLSRWFSEQILGKTLNQAAHDGEQAFIFFDEVSSSP